MNVIQHNEQIEEKQSSKENNCSIKIRWEDIQTVLTTQKSNSRKNKAVNVKRTNASNKNKITESRKYYEEISGTGAVKTVGGSGIVYAVGAYVVDLAVEQVFLETIGAELAYAAGIGASAGPVGLVIGGVGVLGSIGYTYWRNEAEKSNLNLKKLLNNKVKLYNKTLDEMKQLENDILTKKNELKVQEHKLNNETFQIERYDNNKSKVIVAVGPTGYGKSLVCNRLIGNKQDIDDLSDSKTSDFEVAEFGSTESQTSQLQKHSKNVYITENNKENDFILSTVDTPGAFDSNGNDNFYQNSMAEYFRSCGGINIFCIFFKLGGKNDDNYKKLLQIYECFWGEDIWKHCVVVITHCDRDSKKNANRVEKGFPKTSAEIKVFLQVVSNNLCNNVPIYEFGEDNFEESTKQLFISLIDTKSKFSKKYECDNIKSPIDKLWLELKPLLKKHARLQRKLRNMVTQMRETKNQIQ